MDKQNSGRHSSRKRELIPWLISVVAVVLLVDDSRTWGIACLLVGLILRLDFKLAELKSEPSHSTTDSPATQILRTKPSDTDERFDLDVTDASLESHYGWDRIYATPSRQSYKRSFCFGGPPAFSEEWIYQIEKRDVVFQRLVTRSSDGMYREEFDVFKGCVQEIFMEQANREHDREISRLKARGENSLDFGPPYREETITLLKRQTKWHEVQGVVRYFLLSLHHPSGYWKNEIEKLQSGCAKLRSDAASLGICISDDGDLDLPAGADVELKHQFYELLSLETLRRKYGIRSHQDWRDQRHIFRLLSEPAKSDDA